ncbi:MAG: hypothetical protein R3E39_05285 [Anaerolineae bacterium]
MAARKESISGNYWGAVAVATLLAASVFFVGLILSAQGLRVARTGIYYLYMIWLVIIMPGLYSMLRGRDDRNAAIAFSLLSFFNTLTSISMFQRGLIGPWLPESA